MRTVSDLFDLSIHFISPFTSSPISSSLPSSCSSCCLTPSTSLMSWITSPRTSAEELSPLAEKNSFTGYEPNDHFITEAYVEYTQESVSEQRFREDFDYDDITIGQTLLNACRRRADHSEEEGLPSCLSSSSMSHDRTVKTVVCKAKKFRDKTLKVNRLGLFSTDKGSKSSLTVKRRYESTNSRLIMTEEVYKN